jgi:hypothetical protein
MATRNAVINRAPSGSRDCVLVTWEGLLFSSTDDGSPLEDPGFSDRSVQVVGTLGAGGSVRIEGSNDGVTYHVLTDPQGNALDIASLKIEAVTELTRYIRPRITAGDGTTDLDVILLARRA